MKKRFFTGLWCFLAIAALVATTHAAQAFHLHRPSQKPVRTTVESAPEFPLQLLQYFIQS